MLVAMETIVLPSSFLLCIPAHNAMKTKLPFNKADWSGVRKRKKSDWQMQKSWKKTPTKQNKKNTLTKGRVGQELLENFNSMVILLSQHCMLPDTR